MPTKFLSLSLVIPAYNEENHLRACLDAVASQTVAPDEVIVVDNGSSDKTAAIAKSYGFVKTVQESKKGVVFARNTGFDSVNGDIIGRIDADTILSPEWVEHVKIFYSISKNSKHALSGGCYYYNIRLPKLQGWLQGQVAFRFNRFLMGHYILFGSNMAIPKALWEAVKHNVCHDLDVHEDLDLAIHLHRLGYKITYQDGLKVGVKMRRVRSQRGELWGNLLWWPKTLYRHGNNMWVFGMVGAVVIFCLAPLENVNEYIARLFGRKPIKD